MKQNIYFQSKIVISHFSQFMLDGNIREGVFFHLTNDLDYSKEKGRKAAVHK